MIKAIIIEDELNAVEVLVKMLTEKHSHRIKIEGTAGSITGAKALIRDKAPDLIFLDILLEDGSSFNLLDDINAKKIKVIFTTAYDQHAIKAFQFNTIDYLLKPISYKDLDRAIRKVSELTTNQFDNSQLKLFIEQALNEKRKILTIHTYDGIELLDMSDIIRLEANGSYCTIHLINRNPVVASKPMKDIEINLNSDHFLKVHKSHIVNPDYIIKYIYTDGGSLMLKDGMIIPVARRKKDDILARILGNT